jgi:hypothetical protein
MAEETGEEWRARSVDSGSYRVVSVGKETFETGHTPVVPL